MIKEGYSKEEILKQSQKLDTLINKVMFEGYNQPSFFIYIISEEVIYMKEFIIRKRGNYVQRTCRIEEELLDKLEELSYENNQSVNSIINDCIRFALENMAKEQQNFNAIFNATSSKK